MENIKLSEVKRLLLEGLEPFMNKYGYKMNKGKFAFIKKEKDRTSMLYFTENHWFDEVQIMPAVEVSIHEIENIIKKFSGVAMNFYDRAYWMNLNKLSYWYEGKSLADFEYNDKDKYIIKNYTSDIDQAIKGISADFEKYGLRYIDEFGTVEGINKLLNNHSEKLDNTDFLFINRLIIGPIASNILNIDYLHCIDSRINYINENIDEMDEDYVNLFFQVKKYLEQ